jgi:hypothetical protein
MSEPTKFMSVKDFCEKGFLQELNRGFLHPLGLALEVIVPDKDDKDGVWSFGQVWDYREYNEGMTFGDLTKDSSKEKAHNVFLEAEKHKDARLKEFGWIVQPIGHKF